MPEVTDIVRCPKEVAESGYLKLVGYAGFVDTGCRPSNLEIKGWLVMEYDPAGKGRMVGETFTVSEEEIEEWSGCC